MTSNRRTTRRPARRRSGRIRAVISLGAVAVLAMGLSVKGTFAFWTDSATVNSGTFTSGTLDISANGALAGVNGGSTVVATLSGTNLVPGESIAVSFAVKNEGNVPLTYAVTATGAGGLAVANGMRYSIAYGVAATNTGTAVTTTRVGSCGGAVNTDANTTALTATATTLTASRSLAAGTPETVCIIARLDSSAPNTLQNLSGTASFVFDSKQVGAP